MESYPLRGLFGVSSPRPVEQRVAPQPTEPTEELKVEQIFSQVLSATDTTLRMLNVRFT